MITSIPQGLTAHPLLSTRSSKTIVQPGFGPAQSTMGQGNGSGKGLISILSSLMKVGLPSTKVSLDAGSEELPNWAEEPSRSVEKPSNWARVPRANADKARVARAVDGKEDAIATGTGQEAAGTPALGRTLLKNQDTSLLVDHQSCLRAVSVSHKQICV